MSDAIPLDDIVIRGGHAVARAEAKRIAASLELERELDRAGKMGGWCSDAPA